MRAGLAAEQLVVPTDDYFREMDDNVVGGEPARRSRSPRSKAATCGWCGPAATIASGIG